MTEKKAISTSGAPQNDLPYSQGMLADGFLFIAGQGPTDPDTMEQVTGDVGDEARRTLRNLRAIVQEAGGSLDDVVKVTIYLDDIDDYDAVNEVYGEFFDEDPPARVCIEAGRLPGDIGVEIEAIAHLG